jgi:Na+/melibiose symporter-like transporter
MKPLVAIGECGFWVLILSMRADVCDWDEFKTGSRSEGLIAAITNWCNKIAMTLAIAISGFLLQYVVQFDSKLLEETETAVKLQATAEYQELPDSEIYAADGSTIITLDMYEEKLRRQAVIEKQSPGTMERMRILYTLPQAFALIICFFLLRRYPLTKGIMKEIRDELETRRGKTDGA